MRNLLSTAFLLRVRRYLATPELLVLAITLLVVEIWGPLRARNDVDDILLVLLLTGLFAMGCSMSRVRSLPLTQALLSGARRTASRLRQRMVLSLGLDFHPERQPRLPGFTGLRRATGALALAAVVLYLARGFGRDLLAATRVSGLYTFHIVLLGAVWLVLIAGIAAHVSAAVLGIMELIKSRTHVRGGARLGLALLGTALLLLLLVGLQRSVGLPGCVAALFFACLLPSVVRAIDPPRGPWLNLSLGQHGRPSTARLGELVRDSYQLFALEAFLIVCAFAPLASGPSDALFPVTDMLLAFFGWSAAWLFTGGAILTIGEFNRRRRLFDPAFERSRVLWAVPGPEASALAAERPAIEAAGWRLVIDEWLPGPDDADLLVGLPAGLAPSGAVPLARVPAAMFLLTPEPGAVLARADESDKATRARTIIERMLVANRPRLGDRGEGTFLVPQCWLVVGLTRDDDRGSVDRPPPMTFGQSFQSMLGTRLRRFLQEVMGRAGIDVFYVEDSVTPQQAGEVLQRLFERHIERVEPGRVGEVDFLGITGVRVVLHEVDPEGEGIPGVDAHVTRNAISRARILIIGGDKRDGGDEGGGPPVEGESSDLWLRDSLRRMFPRLQPA